MTNIKNPGWPENLLQYLANSVALIWLKKSNHLPNWMVIKQAAPIANLASEELLQLLKAKAEGFLTLKLDPDQTQLWQNCQQDFETMGITTQQQCERRWPEIEMHCRRILIQQYKQMADTKVISAATLEIKHLLTRPIKTEARFAILEPGLKSGIKCVCCEANGAIRNHLILFPHEPQNQWQQGLRKLENCVTSNKIETLILITGEGYRESRAFVKQWLSQTQHDISCYKLNGSFKQFVTSPAPSESADPLYAVVDSFIPLVLDPFSVLDTLNLKCLFHNPLLTIVSQVKLSQALRDEYQTLKSTCSDQTMSKDPLFDTDITQFDDLKENMSCNGQIINQVDYGYFIDIGIHENGLLHNKHLPNNKSLRVGDTIPVVVLNINSEKRQYSLKYPDTRNKSHNRPNKPQVVRSRAPANSAMADALKAAFKQDKQ